ncbi:capsular biosynthesis protein [Aureimonas populi]|uniref:Capsular biosynthesis protein n=1 Tax=Aureimonas populi TaxID=1701758 RepID=A0ABW5CL10_9HYPH|nr:capsular biosynthesis protein [Aureimonas populi]
MTNSSNVVALPVAGGGATEAGRVPRVLLLQGPVGPFFRKLQDALNEGGFDAWRVTFNAGDRFFARGHKTVNYGERPSRYASWLRALLVDGGFSMVVLFGCARPIHEIARNVCRKLSIPVLSLEEGYFRPGFVTMEEGGNCAASPIAGRLPSEDGQGWTEPVRSDSPRSSFAQMGRYAAVYYLVHGLLSRRAERRFFHKRERLNLMQEAHCWARSAFRKYADLPRNSACMERLLERHDGQFYLVPLQVPDDGQLHLRFGLGWSNTSVIERLVASFARRAPRATRLVFKVHPIDRGHFDYVGHVQAIAELHGVSGRVDVLSSGSVGLMARHCRGMITINSSSGFSALHHGRPLGVLGRAIYGHEQLVSLLGDDTDIDRFWTEARAAPAALRQEYLGWLRARSLKPGDFYLAEEFAVTAQAVTDWCAAQAKSPSRTAYPPVVAFPADASLAAG